MVHNIITIRANGPIICRGNFQLESNTGELITYDNELYLCRCGASKSKPLCDGMHKKCNFTHHGEFTDSRQQCQLLSDNKVVISCVHNAMLLFNGSMTLQSESTQSTTTRKKLALCCCGKSNNKPFCDASHKSSFSREPF